MKKYNRLFKIVIKKLFSLLEMVFFLKVKVDKIVVLESGIGFRMFNIKGIA